MKGEKRSEAIAFVISDDNWQTLNGFHFNSCFLTMKQIHFNFLDPKTLCIRVDKGSCTLVPLQVK